LGIFGLFFDGNIIKMGTNMIDLSHEKFFKKILASHEI